MTTIEAFSRDVRIRRSFAGQSKAGGGSRSAVTGFSQASRRRLKFALNNITGLDRILTLTIPGDLPMTGTEFKKKWSAMRRFLVRRDLGGLWVLEFQQSGAPHLHVFLNGYIAQTECADAWAKILGLSSGYGAYIERIRNIHAAKRYATKIDSKVAPEGFGKVGRYWGTFGGVKLIPEFFVSGKTTDIAPLVRTVRKAALKLKNKRIHDRGMVGFVLPDFGPVSQKILRRICSKSYSDSTAQ